MQNIWCNSVKECTRAPYQSSWTY